MGGGNGAEPGGESSRSGGLKREAPSPDKQPGPKRSRVSRACDQCRASREKCDGGQPVCQTCTAQKRKCSYDEQPKKRGIQPNYIRTLELTLAWMFKTSPDCERALANSLAAQDAATRQQIGGKDGQSETLHQRWRDSIICRQIDQMLSGTSVERPNATATDELLQSPPPTTALEPTALQTESCIGAEATDVATNHSLTQLHHKLHQPPRQQPHQKSDLHTQQGLHLAFPSEPHLDTLVAERLRLPDHAWTLLEYYFAFTHAWLPMTDRQATLKLMYTYPTDGVHRFGAANGDYAELWSILALAASQFPHQPGAKSDTEELHSIARSLIPSERSTFELGHLKAIVLLAVLELSKQQWMAAWMLVGSAVRVILAILNNRRNTCSAALFDPGTPLGNTTARGIFAGRDITPEQLKPVGLAAFVLESAVACRLGAPTHLQPEHITLLGSVEEDGMEEWSPWHDPLCKLHAADIKTPARSFSTLNQLVRLALRNESMGWADHNRLATNAVLEAVLGLLRNAAQTDSRLQPAIIVSQFDTVRQEGAMAGFSGTDHGHSQTLSNTWHLRGPSNAFAPQHLPLRHDLPQLGYMSIPESAESAFSDSPVATVGNPNVNNALWLQGEVPAATNAHSDASGGSTIAGADIFEELALLERTDSRSNPQFMQNLGFAPDIDLAEFFGADYQPSDPMLAYMQPSLFKASLSENRLPPDAG